MEGKVYLPQGALAVNEVTKPRRLFKAIENAEKFSNENLSSSEREVLSSKLKKATPSAKIE